MLGRGLESLIPKKNGGDETNQPPFNTPASESSISKPIPKQERMISESVFQIEIEKIKPNPHQPRRDFNEESLRELALSIREFGVLQPLVVSKIETENESGTSVEYELIAGERRLMAAKMAGLPTVPVIIKKIQSDREKLELAVIENIQRADLNPIEKARAFARLQDEFKLTQREVASKLGKSRESVANTVRLLNLPSEIQEVIARGVISESQARLLLTIEDIVSQRKLFEEILKENLSVREIKNRVRGSNVPKEQKADPQEAQPVMVDPELIAIKEQLEEFFGTKIDLNKIGDGGKLTINFYSSEELKSIIDKLFKQSDNQSPSPL